jgi:hypothetical protein
MRSFLPAGLLLAGLTALATPSFAQSPDPIAALKRALAAGAANKITSIEEFWMSPSSGWMGVEGRGADGWYEVVMDPSGKVIRAGKDEGKKYPVAINAAVDTALANGIVAFRQVGLDGDGKWKVIGTDAAGKVLWMVIDATTGAVMKGEG